MSDSALTARHTWQPFTPRGVAGFARRSFRRVAWYAIIMAALAGLVMAWFLSTAWVPVLREAIQQLPAGTFIAQGRLHGTLDSPLRLAADERLGFELDPEGTGAIGNESDVKVVFRRRDVSVCSLFGCAQWTYPAGYRIGFSRAELEPWWGAREWIFRWGAALATTLGVLLNWLVLATLYCPIAKAVARLAKRPLPWSGAWRLSLASLMPGAVVMMAGIIGYGLGWFGLVRLGLLNALHFVLGWAFVAASPWFLSRTLPATGPFAQATTEPAETKTPPTPEPPVPGIAESRTAVEHPGSPVESAATLAAPERVSDNPFAASADDGSAKPEHREMKAPAADLPPVEPEKSMPTPARDPDNPFAPAEITRSKPSDNPFAAPSPEAARKRNPFAGGDEPDHG